MSTAPQRGVIYYNTGTGCLVRLLVSLYSLRRHYAGPVTILSDGETSHPGCTLIAAALGAEVKEWTPELPPGKNQAYLAKTVYYQGSPYETTLALDADTLIVGPVDELFTIAEESTFAVAQISDWRSDGPVASARIRQWAEIAPEQIGPALAFGPMINAGVVAFTRQAPLLRDWAAFALRGRHCFIPDEVACQILLRHYPHRILETIWNCSCKHDRPARQEVRIIHYHGKKHCRLGLPYHGETWVRYYDEVLSANVANVQQWTPAGDRTLSAYLRERARQGQGSPRLILGYRDHDAVPPGWTPIYVSTRELGSSAIWEKALGGQQAERLVAENVWQRLDDTSLPLVTHLAFQHLRPGGCLRLAVPDALHPEENYRRWIRPGGKGWQSSRSVRLWDHETLTTMLETAGFKVQLLEHWDKEGVFHHRPWSLRDGAIHHSALHDARNRHGRLAYTSLMVDAWKP